MRVARPSPSTETNALVVWQDNRRSLNFRNDYDLSGTSYSPFAARLTPQGALLDAVGFPVLNAHSAEFGPLAVAFNGANYFVVGDGTGVVQLTRVTTGGVVLDPNACQHHGQHTGHCRRSPLRFAKRRHENSLVAFDAVAPPRPLDLGTPTSSSRSLIRRAT